MTEPIEFHNLEDFKKALEAAGIKSVKIYGDMHISNDSNQALLVSYKSFSRIFEFAIKELGDE